MKRIALLVLLSCVILAAQLNAAENQIIWKIGESDKSYAEFAIAGHNESYQGTFSAGITFEVGKSDPSKDWAYIQPGPIDAWANGTERKSQIIFDLADDPIGTYIFKIDMVDCHWGFPPAVNVNINNKSQLFEVAHGVSDASLTDPTKGRKQTIKMYIDARHLQKGKNTVRINNVTGSWIIYDYIELVKSNSPIPTVDNLALTPTCLFKENAGKLKQVIVANCDVYKECERIRAITQSEKGWQVEQSFENIETGHSNLDIEVPVVSSPEKVHIKLIAGDQVCEADTTISPQKQWNIYLLASAHFDIGYTSIQDEALKVHRDNTQRAMDWQSKYPNFIWNCESAYQAEDFLSKNSQSDAFLTMARKNQLGIQGFFANELTGLCSGEELTRLVDYYDVLRRTYGIESKCAMQNDVPSMVATVPMVLAGHGIKYLSHGVNSTRGFGNHKVFDTPYYWEAPDGSKVLAWQTPGYGQCGVYLGGSINNAGKRINQLISGYNNRKDYPYDAILLHGGYSDNQPNETSLPNICAEWNKSYAYPKLIFCRGSEFFEHIESKYADKIKTYKGDSGVWWEDGAASSAYETAITRTAKIQLATAEKLAVLSASKTNAQIAEAWKNVLLYDEHTWGAAQSIDAPNSKETLGQWAVKKSFADKAGEQASKVLEDTTKGFFSKLNVSQNSVVVFNPSGWARSEEVSIVAPNGKMLSLYADSVPPMGYKVFPISKASRQNSKLSNDAVLDNKYYTVSFNKDTGAVKSIYDKQLKRELIDASQYGANQYMYVTGGEGSTVLGSGMPKANLKVDVCSGATFNKTVLSDRQEMIIDCEKAPKAKRLISKVVLYNNSKRIDFINEMNKEANLAKEAGYFAFPFAFKNPKMKIEIPNGSMQPEVDQFPGACRDWYAVQDYMTVSDGSAAVVLSPWDSPLVTLQDINRGQWYKNIEIKNGNVFAYLFNNYWFTNYKASQEGPLTFRYSLTSGKSFTDASAKRFGESSQTPMVAKFVSAKKNAKPNKAQSFVQVKSENVLMQALSSARFTNGSIIRLREMNGKKSNVQIALNGISFKQAYLCNLAEDKLGKLKVNKGVIEVPCKAYGLTTVLLER